MVEPTIEDTIKIVMGLKPYFEEFHGLKYTNEAIRTAVDLSARYITDRKLPDKAIDVIDEAGAAQWLVPENKRRKKLFEKLYLEGRPPINIAISSSGDFFGGSQVALTDVLGDQNFVFTAYALREFRNYQFDYLNLGDASLVFGRIARATASGSRVSTNVNSRPRRASTLVKRRVVPP